MKSNTVNAAIFGIVMIFSPQVFSQMTWVKEFTAGYSTHGEHLFKAHDGNLILCGHVHDSGGPDHVYVVKSDTSGNLLWANVYDDSYGYCPAGTNTSDSGLVVAGDLHNLTTGWGTSLMKMDASGTFQWLKVFSQAEIPFSLICTSDHGFLIGGRKDTSYSSSTRYRSFIIKTDSAGNLQWQRNFIIGANVNFPRVLETRDGNYLLYGTADINYGVTYGIFAIKVDTNAQVLWSKAYGNGMVGGIAAATETFDGGFLFSVGDPSGGSFLIRADNDGYVSWSRHLDESPVQIRQTSDSCFYFLLNSGLVKTDSLANVLWAKKYLDPVNYQYPSLLSFIEKENRSVFVLGKSWPNVNTANMLLLKFNAGGDHCSEFNYPFSISSTIIPDTVQSYNMYIPTPYPLNMSVTERHITTSTIGCISLEVPKSNSIRFEFSARLEADKLLYTFTSDGHMDFQVTLLDLAGRRIFVKDEKCEQGNFNGVVSVDKLVKGMYVFTIQSDKLSSSSVKVIKE